MRTRSVTTPPHRTGSKLRKDPPPTLTPSSLSSSDCSPDCSVEESQLFSFKSTTRDSNNNKARTSNSSSQDDKFIIRGAAAVRESLCDGLYSDEVTDWSDPFQSVASSGSELDLTAMALEDAASRHSNFCSASGSRSRGSRSRASGLSQPFDERIHWASVALEPKEERNNIPVTCTPTRASQNNSFIAQSVEELKADLQVLERDIYVHRNSGICGTTDVWHPGDEEPEIPKELESRRAAPTTTAITRTTKLVRGQSILDENDSIIRPLAGDKYSTALDEQNARAKPPVPPKGSGKKEPPINLDSPLSKEYMALQRDPAYIHAQAAGCLWQSLVGQHVRFPRTWWSEARAPPMGMPSDQDTKWKYVARHRVADDGVLNHLVRTRSSAGRLLLHFVVRDIMTLGPVLDIAVGVFHPNARGVRTCARPRPELEGSRFVWMALRKRVDSISLLDNMLCGGRMAADIVDESPLGPRKAVDNRNMRAVFGEQPPLHTICIQESELFQKLNLAAEIDPASASKPALMLLHEFLVLV